MGSFWTRSLLAPTAPCLVDMGVSEAGESPREQLWPLLLLLLCPCEAAALFPTRAGFLLPSPLGT